jgi:predicted transposase YdaD
MKTDPSIYEFLATGAEAFRVLSGGVILHGAYRFTSLTLKGIERRLDGIYEPEGHDGPVYVIEFQAQYAASAWYNLLTKIGLYGQEHPQRAVQGMLIFLHAGDDPGAPPGALPPLCTVGYLDAILPQWLEREPDNPFVVVFAPLIITGDDALRACAPRALRTIREAPSLAPTTRATLERMLEFWLIERFPLLSSEELRTMLNVLVPLEQTRVYQEIFAKGKADGDEVDGQAKGQAEGEVKGKADSLKRLLTRRFGVLPRWAAQRLDAAAIVQLDGWLEGIFDAPSLDALIGPKPGRVARKGP